MDAADSSSVDDQQLKSIGVQKRIVQLEHKTASIIKQLDEKSAKLKEVQEQNGLLKDRLGIHEQEKLEASLLTETLAKSRDRLIQEKTDLRNELLGLEKRKDELELQVSKLSNDRRHHLEEIDELRTKCGHLCGERTELQSQIDDFQSDKALIAYDKEQWKREKEILLMSKQWYMDEIADREQKINELIETKADAARRMLECQNECHALRLAADRARHESDVQARLMQAKEIQVEQLHQRVQQYAHERDEAEARAAHCTRARDELLQQAEHQQVQHQRAAEARERDTLRQLNEERARIVDELSARSAAELERVQTEATCAQKRLTEMLKRASETHRKLEDERNKLFEKHKLLEENLDAYKRRFVAELQRAMDTRCSQMGMGMRNAFVDVVGQMNSENTRPQGNGSEEQRRETDQLLTSSFSDPPMSPRTPPAKRIITTISPLAPSNSVVSRAQSNLVVTKTKRKTTPMSPRAPFNSAVPRAPSNSAVPRAPSNFVVTKSKRKITPISPRAPSNLTVTNSKQKTTPMSPKASNSSAPNSKEKIRFPPFRL